MTTPDDLPEIDDQIVGIASKVERIERRLAEKWGEPIPDYSKSSNGQS